MNSTASSSIPTVPASLSTPVPVPRSLKAARDFEATLIQSLLESLEKTFGTIPGEESFAGADDYNYMGTQALAGALSAHGGFGIADMIAAHLPAGADKE